VKDCAVTDPLARLRTAQRSSLGHVPIWVLTGAQSSRLPESVPDRASELACRRELDVLLQEEPITEVMAAFAAGADVVIEPEVREQLEHLAHVAAVADRHAGDGYLDPRVEAWQRPKGLEPPG
jgi:hypothetical protein